MQYRHARSVPQIPMQPQTMPSSFLSYDTLQTTDSPDEHHELLRTPPTKLNLIVYTWISLLPACLPRGVGGSPPGCARAIGKLIAIAIAIAIFCVASRHSTSFRVIPTPLVSSWLRK